MLNLKRSSRVVIIAGGLLAITATAWSVQHRYFQPAAPKPAVKMVAKTARPIVYDEALLKRYNDLVSSFDLSKPCTYSGTMSSHNPVDSSADIKAAKFVFAKNGKDCYYHIGQLEALNADGVLLSIDHANKLIQLGAQRDLMLPGLPDLKTLLTMLKSEGYALQSKMNGSQQTISFVNERHISCKEYAFTLDTGNHKLLRSVKRLTEFNDPEDRKKDKTLTMEFDSFSQNASIKTLLDKGDVVHKRGGQWELTEKFAAYRLTFL